MKVHSTLGPGFLASVYQNALIWKIHEVQLVNYLVATGLDEGLLLNFGTERLEFKRNLDVQRKAKKSPSEIFC
jgi:hypothetical protein